MGDTPRGQPIKVGYLTKMGEVRKTWRKRWFQLESNNALCYYKDASYVTGKPLGSIIVSGCMIEALSPVSIGRPFAFSIIPPMSGERVYYIFADSARDYQEWIDALGESARRPSSRRSRGISQFEDNPHHDAAALYSTSMPLQIRSEVMKGREPINRNVNAGNAGGNATGKAALAERRQKRMHSNSISSSEQNSSYDSDFDDDDDDELEAESSIFACDDIDADKGKGKARLEQEDSNIFHMSVVLSEASSLLLLPDFQKCADCQAHNPQFISVNLGLSLCANCADVHKTFPNDVSVIRSVSADSFSKEELQKLREMGNRRGNEYWEATVPPDMNRSKLQTNALLRAEYIEKKYVQKLFLSPEKKSETSKWKADDSTSSKSRIAELEAKLAAKEQEVIELRKTIENMNANSEMTSSFEKLKRQLDEEEQCREEAEEARLAAEEKAENVHRMYLEERNKRRELFEVVRVLQESAKAISDGFLLITTHMDDSVGPQSNTPTPRQQLPLDSFVSAGYAQQKSTSLQIHSRSVSGADSLVFEKIAFK